MEILSVRFGEHKVKAGGFGDEDIEIEGFGCQGVKLEGFREYKNKVKELGWVGRKIKLKIGGKKVKVGEFGEQKNKVTDLGEEGSTVKGVETKERECRDLGCNLRITDRVQNLK